MVLRLISFGSFPAVFPECGQAHTTDEAASRFYREPDVAYMCPEHVARCLGKYWDGADLVMEVVSETNREHDTETKREEYLKTGIPEYWLVEPAAGRITVLRLEAPEYQSHGVYVLGQTATSVLLTGFSLDVGAVLDAQWRRGRGFLFALKLRARKRSSGVLS